MPKTLKLVPYVACGVMLRCMHCKGAMLRMRAKQGDYGNEHAED